MMGLHDDGQRERFAELVRDRRTQIDGFYWCGGATWDARDYRAVLLASRPGQSSAAVECVGRTARHLAAAMRRLGCVPPRRLAELCERAPRSPRRPS